MSNDYVTRLFPAPQQDVPLEGLYLQHALRYADNNSCPCVYTNFISSLDGRIAVEHPERNSHAVPAAITNERDWRLFQELAAQADVLVTSARYLRELSLGNAQDALPLSNKPAFVDLHAWRKQQGLSPQPAVVILSASLNLPLDCLADIAKQRQVFVATGRQADAVAIDSIKKTGTKILYTGEGKQVDGKPLIDALLKENFRSIYSIAGPGVLQTLLHANVLNRLYLTQVHRLIGGASFDTLLEGAAIQPPADFSLQALYYDHADDPAYGQFFCVYEVADVTKSKS
ncbi:MAG TPA: dihydrofolate reductase family protein [Gammaproteobacteria bacterium]